MSNTKELKKAGIDIVKKLSEQEVQEIAQKISQKICASFPEHHISRFDLFNALCKVSMYLAKFQDSSVAKYNYKNETMYFKEDVNFEKLDAPIIHECLHFIQTVKTKGGTLLKLGLYNATKIKPTGLALNEAAVQLMSSEASETKEDSVKYYGMNINTNSPDYYPVECSIVKQMTYFTGTYPLYHSALYSDDIFENTFIMKSNKKAYNKILKNLDLITEFQEAIDKENVYLSNLECDDENDKRIEKSRKNIEILKSEIKDITLSTQELILTSCAEKSLNYVRNDQSASEFKNTLYNFKDILIKTENYSFYNEFYYKMMDELDVRRELIEKYGIVDYMEEVNNYALLETRLQHLNIFSIAVEKIKKLFHINKESQEMSNQKLENRN